MTLNSDNLKTIEELWEHYRRYKDKETRDALIIHYSPLVKYVASRVAVGLPRSVEQSDLASYGIFGLIDAIEKFDPSRNVKFETYAMTRIKGAIIDQLRATDWVPRSVRAAMKQLKKAYDKLEIELKRSPLDSELAKEMSISEEELYSIYKKIAAAGIVALDEVMGFMEHSTHYKDNVVERGESPSLLVEENELKEILRAGLKKLPERERIVLTLYYFEGFNLAQIGQTLGVTESRACQIHARGVILLRSAIERQLR
jgi:RNA polymerase sigma factor for flagellar operon FliA